jgi:hypothetical protein
MRLRSIHPLLAAVLTLAAHECAAAQDGCTVPAGRAVLIATEPLEMIPGERRVLQVGMSEAPHTPMEPLPGGCAVRWAVTGGQAHINPDGRLRVHRYTKPGTELTVTAEVAGRTVRQAVHVVDPHPNPIAGTWEQAGAAECAGGAPAEPVRELVIRRDGRFTATFTPFESYKDYWGVYTYDRDSGALDMHAVGGNQVPPGLDLAGTARVAGGRLTLRDMWLGQPGPGTPRACTYVFTHS